MQLITNEIDLRLTGDTNAVLISSPGKREGKTMLAINLAQALALRGKSVLLIDGNLWKPDASKILNAGDSYGLADALAGGRDPRDFIIRMDLFDVLAAGGSSVPPVELLSRLAASLFISDVKQKYNAVIVDGPPALGFSDAMVLARQVGAVVVVARAGTSRREAVDKAAELFEHAGVGVMGVVVNFVPPDMLRHLAHGEYAQARRHKGQALDWPWLSGIKRLPFRRRSRKHAAPPRGERETTG
jgi:capsular exopolysaccharide synthesis family protein